MVKRIDGCTCLFIIVVVVVVWVMVGLGLAGGGGEILQIFKTEEECDCDPLWESCWWCDYIPQEGD